MNHLGATRRGLGHLSCAAAALGRSAVFLCRARQGTLALALVAAGALSACGGGGDSGTGTGTGTTYTIGGTVSGLATGQSLSLANGSETLTRSANGAFTFVTSVAQGGSYEVKLSGAQPAWQTCSIGNATGSAVSANVTNVAVSCASADMAATGLLNDTGIDWCSENITTPSTWVNNVVCSTFNWVAGLWGQQQDAFFGRDAQAKALTLQKVGGGMAGFDFTKVGASGKVLTKQGEIWSDSGSEAAGTQWDCVRDNVTGLVWEVKRNDANHLRHMGHTYTWYNVSTTNGGSAGTEASSSCTGVADVSKCNTQSYVTAVNAAGLCGKTDWRMPTVDELRNLAHTGRTNPAIDTNYFPNTASIYYWSSSPLAFNGDGAWSVSFYNGLDYSDYKSDAHRVRLVRSGQ